MFLAMLAILLTLVLVIGIHEAGHAFVASLCKVKIQKISIGFGKPLVQWTSKSGCDWVWAMWPLGGYVQLLNTRISPVDTENYPYCFDKKPIWQRVLILLAGVSANLITAWLAFVVVFLLGMPNRPAVIESVVPKSRVAQAGFVAGDQVLALGDEATPSWREVGMQLVILWGKPTVKVLVKSRDSQQTTSRQLDLSRITLGGHEKSLLSGLGIVVDTKGPGGLDQASSIGDAMERANQTILQLLVFFTLMLKQLFTRAIPFSVLLGPLGLFAASVTSLSQGLVMFMYFIANLSMAVAIVNLLPVPGLDGGSIVYSLLEKIRGKPLTVAMEVLLYQLALVIFGLALVQLLLNDVQRFFM